MSPKDLKHFLIVYRVSESRTEVTEYDSERYDEALDDYRASEQAHRDEPGTEIVLLSADSEDSLRATHGRFFADSRRHVDDYITERLDELLGEREHTPA